MTEQTSLNFPVEVIGLPKDDIDTRRAEIKFRKSIEALAHVHPDMSEARAIVKTSSESKDPKRYEVRVLIRLPKEQFDFSDEGWSVEELFENVGVKLKRLMTKPRDKPSHRRHPSRMEAERERFAE